MSIVVTGATGHLGHLVVEDLLARGVPAAEIVATGRATEKLVEFADRGVTLRRVDFADAASIATAIEPGDTVLLVSGNEMGQRVAQHQAVIDAAVAAGVEALVYTSAPRADTTSMLLAAEHRETEKAILASGVPSVILRNGWYVENYTDQLDTYFEHQAMLGSAGVGRISAAPRADFAGAAAVVLADVGPHLGQAYELGGDESFTLAELAAAIREASGRPVAYTDLPPADHLAALVGAGVPEPMAAMLVDVDRAIGEGALLVESGDLARLLGRPPTTITDALATRFATRD